jgi:hypothetical protein
MARVSARLSVVSGRRQDSNLTGFSTLALLVIGKGLQLFKEIAQAQPPSLVAVMAGLARKAPLPAGRCGEP